MVYYVPLVLLVKHVFLAAVEGIEYHVRKDKKVAEMSFPTMPRSVSCQAKELFAEIRFSDHAQKKTEAQTPVDQVENKISPTKCKPERGLQY